MKFMQISSCKTSMPPMYGVLPEYACTSCPANYHHTITNPTLNVGSCTLEECPACKPRDYCGEHHKHYVLNTASLEGVCVRQTNDCTPLCVPRDITALLKGHGNKRSNLVCSKGCNQPTRYGNQIIACALEKRVICKRLKSKVSQSTGFQSLFKCEETRWGSAKAVCTLSNELGSRCNMHDCCS